jgi:hypothetical protein
MSGQIAQFGVQSALNHVAGQSEVLVQGTAPAWYPGVTWVNSALSYTVMTWAGAAGWIAPYASNRYLALLTADPVAGGVVNLQDPGWLEVQTSGYARQPVAFSTAANTYPTSTSNNALITFGPMTATMVNATEWVALVTAPTSAGTAGLFLFSWALVAPVAVQASQSIQISPGQLVLDFA